MSVQQKKIAMSLALALAVVSGSCSGSAGENNRQTSTQDNSDKFRVGVPSETTSASKPSPPLPSSLSPAENLEKAKKELASENGEGIAVMHLDAIPKNAKEYAEAQKLLAQIKARNKQKAPSSKGDIQDELARLDGEEERLNKALDMYQDYEGPATSTTKANAKKRLAEINLRRIQLQRQLKGKP